MIVVASRTSARPSTKRVHRLLQRALVHLAVGDDDARLGHGLADAASAIAPIDATRLWTKNTWPPRASSVRIASRTTSRRNGRTWVCTARRSRGGVSMTDTSRRPEQAEVERARDRRGRQRQHVDRGLERLELLLLGDAEALLLVDDEQAEVAERDVLGEQAVGADDDVDRCRRGARRRSSAAPAGDEPRQPADLDGKAGEAAGEGAEVLLGENRGRRQHRDLLAVQDRLEGGPHRDLGLAVADVADQQAVHRPRRLHVALDLARSPRPGRWSARTRRRPRTRAATASPWRT